LTNQSTRQKQIIEKSINIISRKGIQELTMKNLSNEIGISEPAIYRHFESKQKILIAVLESFKHQNKLLNENAPKEGETAFQHISKSIEMIMNKFKKNPAISAVIFSEEIFQNKNELSEMVKNIMESTTEYFTDLLEKGQIDGSIRTDIGKKELGIIVMGAIRHIVIVWRLSGFSSDLIESGKKLVKSLEVIIAA
jgi:AcrR family transcriptional regulator